MSTEYMTVYTLKHAKNGCVMIIKQPGEEEEILTFTDNESGSAEVVLFQQFLYSILENYGPTTSRYSKDRIYITIASGDKYGDRDGIDPRDEVSEDE